MIRASILTLPIHPCVGAPPLPVALADADDLIVKALDAIVANERLVEETRNTVIGTKGLPKSIVAVGDVLGTIVTVTLAVVNPGAAKLVVGPNGSGSAHGPGGAVSNP